MSKPLYVVAVDGSEWGERAAARAISLAKKTDAKVKFITVMDWSTLQPMMIDSAPSPLLDKETEEKNTIKRVLTPLLEKYHEMDIASDLLWGDPVVVILEQLKLSHASMLFVGRKGRSRFVDILLGSVANKLAHRAGVPIVLVP